MKNYFGFIRDHSISMTNIRAAALKDFNANIEAVREESEKHNQDTIVFTMSACEGRPATNNFDVKNSSVSKLKPLTSYSTNGTATPLFDAVKDMINELKKVPDASDPEVAFLVFVTTDGEDNASYTTDKMLGKMIKDLTASDKWTFVFRVPRGHQSYLVNRLGVSPGNVCEWDQTAKGVEEATIATKSAFSSYMQTRSLGKTSTSTFYTDLSSISKKDLNVNLKDISSEVHMYTVPSVDDGVQIRSFLEDKHGEYKKGCGFYELVKREKAVQDTKKLVIRDKSSRHVYGGAAARQMLGFPVYGSISVAPGDHSNYELFIQSTSVNRKLPAGSKVLYWANA
jgi:hypothetical protein